MTRQTGFFDTMIGLVHLPLPSQDLYARILNSTYALPLHIKLKVSVLIMSVIIAAFAAGFMQPVPTAEQITLKSPYYTGSGFYIVKYLG